jgi:hypothetical protein
MKRLLAPTLVLCLVATGASCGSDDERTDPPAPTTTSPATTEPEPTDEEQVTEVVEGWYDVRVRSSLEGTYDRTEVEMYVIGATLEQFVRVSAERKADDIIIEAPAEDPSRTKVLDVTIDGATAIARECEIDARMQVRGATGEVIDGEIVTLAKRIELVSTEGGWRIERITLDSTMEGSATCE